MSLKMVEHVVWGFFLFYNLCISGYLHTVSIVKHGDAIVHHHAANAQLITSSNLNKEHVELARHLMFTLKLKTKAIILKASVQKSNHAHGSMSTKNSHLMS